MKMNNTDIKYQLCTDYNRLYNLLIAGYKIVGFVGVYVGDISSCDFEYDPETSIVEVFFFDKSYNMMYIYGSMFNWKREDIINRMERMNLRYFDLNN